MFQLEIFFIEALYVTIRAQAAIRTGELAFTTKPVSVEGCAYEFSRAERNVTVLPDDTTKGFHLHHISYLYYSAIGASITLIISFIISLFMGLRDPSEIDSKLLAPSIRDYFKGSSKYKEGDQRGSVVHEFDITNNQIS